MSTVPFISLLLTEDTEHGLYNIISELPLDVRKQSTYSFRAQVTEFPVDDGSNISDNRRILPDEISLEGFVSDSPLVSMASNNLGLKGDNKALGATSVTQSAFDALLAVHREHKEILVVAEYTTFEHMVIESLEIPRDAEKGLGLWFSMKLKQIKIVQNKTAALSPDIVRQLKTKRKKKKKSQKIQAGLSAAKRKILDQVREDRSKGRITIQEANTRLDTAGLAKYRFN